MATAFEDPLLSFQFSIEISGGITVPATAWFTDLSGMGAEQDIIEYKVYNATGSTVKPTALGGSSVGDWVQLIHGRRKPGSITLKHGLTSDQSFWEWREKSLNTLSTTVRSTATIKMYDRAGMVKATWMLYGAVLEKISGPEFKADSSDIGIEEMTIRFATINRITVGGSPSNSPAPSPAPTPTTRP